MENEEEILKPYLRCLKPLEGFKFSAAVSVEGWKELARVLLEKSSGVDHAQRIVEQFVRTPRYDDKGNLLDGVPSSIELRLFAPQVSRKAVPAGELPAPCELCRWSGGVFGPPVQRNGISGVGRCSCARGQALAARDAAREDSRPEDRRRRAAGLLPAPAPRLMGVREVKDGRA